MREDLRQFLKTNRYSLSLAAKMCHCSKGQISFIINGKDDQISDETKQRISGHFRHWVEQEDEREQIVYDACFDALSTVKLHVAKSILKKLVNDVEAIR